VFQVGWPVLTQFISLLLTALATIRGVKTIERVNLVITPAFLLIIIALWIWSLTKEHAWRGLCFLFSPDWSEYDQEAKLTHAFSHSLVHSLAKDHLTRALLSLLVKLE
jgi:SNF family Na+-dependent transporter